MTRVGHVARLVLAIDAAPGVGSVALVRDRVVVRAAAVAMRPQVARPTPAARTSAARTPADRTPTDPDDDPLMRAVDILLRATDTAPTALDAVVCGAGPGGFTSLRIAAAIAKGIAHAAGCPLLAGPSLAWAAAERAAGPGVWLVTLDALRGERYAAVVRVTARTATEFRGAHHQGTHHHAVARDAAREARTGYDVAAYQYLGVHANADLDTLAMVHHAIGRLEIDADATAAPIASGSAAIEPDSVDVGSWEPGYGRAAEAQTRWEAIHGPLHAPPIVVGQ